MHSPVRSSLAGIYYLPVALYTTHPTLLIPTSPPGHSFAVSASVPTRSFSPYFSSTDLPWYFQNCLEASLPAMRLRILAPPGCSSRKPGHRASG